MRARTIASIGLLLASTAAPRAQEIDLDVLLDRLATYLEKYEAELSTLIADERYVQQEHLARQRGQSIGRSRQRRTEAEVLFLRLPGHAEWFGVRDVKKVDGQAVEGTGITLTELMTRPGGDLLQHAAAIVEASSRYNLGGGRTINMPTVPLEALSARNHVRYIFKIAGKARISDTQTVKLEFSEFDEPTLVQSTDGGALWTRGTGWIDFNTGELWRAEIIVGPDAPDEFRRMNLESRMRVEFTRDPRLKLIVPKEVEETFWIEGGIGRGRAQYSNYRKFTTAARIIPEP